MRVYLELRDEKSAKFWEVTVEGAKHRVRYGKIGAKGQTVEREFANEDAAKAESEKLAAGKRKAGYVDATPPEPAADAPAPKAKRAKAPKPSRLAEIDASDAPEGANAFVAALAESDADLHDFGLRALFTNSLAQWPDGGGNLWHLHVTPVGGYELAFCADHEDGSIFRVVPWVVFEAAYDDGELKPAYEDEAALARLVAKKAKWFPEEEKKLRAEVTRLWARVSWLLALLRGNNEEADLREPDAVSDPTVELARPDFGSQPAYALYWLWRAWFFKDETLLAKVVEAAKGSERRVVRDAVALVGELNAGRKDVHGVDLLATREKFQEVVQVLAKRAAKAAEPPKPVDEAAQRARVRRMNMSNPPASVFSPNLPQYRALERLDFGHSPLKELPPALGALKNLKFLRCTGHELTALPKEIGELTRLEELHLPAWTHFSPFAIPEEIGRLASLRVLDLGGCRAGSVPAGLGELSRLERLDLSANGLKELPGSFARLEGLKSLRLDENYFEDLPAVVGELSGLEELDLGEARLSPEIGRRLTSLKRLEATLPAQATRAQATLAGIAALPRLEKLTLLIKDACPDELRTLPVKDLALSIHVQHPEMDGVLAKACEIAALEGLTVLTKLDIKVDRRLELAAKLPNLRRLAWAEQALTWHLPASIGALERLEELSLAGWDLHDVPPEFKKLVRLRKLDLSNNSVRVDPSVFEAFTELRELRWNNNSTGFPVGVEKNPNLEVLTCASCNLQGFPADLSALRHLRVLDLGGSALGDAELASLARAFPSLASIEELRLMGSKGNEIVPSLAGIGALRQLTTLDLTYCGLTRLPEAVGELQNLTDLGIGSNPKIRLDQAFAVVAKLPKLKRLNLFNMALRELPASLEPLSRLEVLDLRSNRFEGGELKRARFSLPDTEVII